ncbi:unnamed protein product [Linum tenue]|uniref:Uncharacterized protein n=1 Tax=Linum tenue TaxID=586396 RepID=A0AAV0HRA8_9ROSI|nr:unnamed protein product [Linum tenue]
MDTISAVQTSVLSRSWNRVWKHVPVLELCRLSFYEYLSFLLFVSEILDLRYDLSLRKLSYMDNYRHRHERGAVSRCRRRCIRVLFLCYRCRRRRKNSRASGNDAERGRQS